MGNIEIPNEIRAKLAPMIVETIVTKLKESGANVDEKAIEKLVNDQSTKVEFPAVVLGNVRGGSHIVCTLLPIKEIALMGVENEITASTSLTLRGDAAKNIIRQKQVS